MLGKIRDYIGEIRERFQGVQEDTVEYYCYGGQREDRTAVMKNDIYIYRHDDMSGHWDASPFKRRCTLDNLALDPELKKSIADDLDRFVRGKEVYEKIGRPWKRGYLLYGPPRIGKSSLVAAIANHLKYSVYDLQLDRIEGDSVSRNLMMSTTNKSIIVIENIDRASEFSRNLTQESYLSGLLKFIDQVWSICGDERIIILTTRSKERIDPALFQRMDMHIHLSYLRMPAFRILASNYLELSEHPLFEEIQQLLEETDVIPLEVENRLFRKKDHNAALNDVITILKKKRSLIKQETQKNSL